MNNSKLRGTLAPKSVMLPDTPIVATNSVCFMAYGSTVLAPIE